MKKFIVALGVLLVAGSSSAAAEENANTHSDVDYAIERLNLAESVPASLDYNLYSTEGGAISGQPENPPIELDTSSEHAELSLRDVILARVSPLGFRVSRSSYLNVSLERGIMIGVTVPCCGKGL